MPLTIEPEFYSSPALARLPMVAAQPGKSFAVVDGVRRLATKEVVAGLESAR
jgi:hypothetical protein